MSVQFLPYAFFEGEYVPFEDARVSVATHALQYGTGVFGGMRGYRSADGSVINLFRMHDHFRRLLQSARMIRIKLPYGIDDLGDIAMELTRRNAADSNVYFRPYAYKSGLNLAPTLSGIADQFALYMVRLEDYYSAPNGLSVMVSTWQRLNDTAIPSRGKVSGSYINSSLANDEAKTYGFDEAIMLDSRGKVSEGSASNLFIVRDGVLLTTPVTASILEGITRRTIITLAADLGIPLEIREIDRTELYIADELFFCGTGVQISPISQVDRREVGSSFPGAITTTLQERFKAVITGQLPAYSEWLTPVPVAAAVAQ